MEKLLATLEENILLSRTIQSLEQHRHELQNGQPCPLCGALEHPFATNMPVIAGKNEDLRQRRAALEILKRELEEDKQKKIKAESSREHALNTRNSEQERLNLQIQNQEQILAELQAADSTFTLPEESERLEELKSLRTAKVATFEHINAQLKEAVETSLTQLRDQEIPALEAAVRNVENTKNAQETALKLGQKDLENQQLSVQQYQKKLEQLIESLNKKFAQ